MISLPSLTHSHTHTQTGEQNGQTLPHLFAVLVTYARRRDVKIRVGHSESSSSRPEWPQSEECCRLKVGGEAGRKLEMYLKKNKQKN